LGTQRHTFSISLGMSSARRSFKDCGFAEDMHRRALATRRACAGCEFTVQNICSNTAAQSETDLSEGGAEHDVVAGKGHKWSKFISALREAPARATASHRLFQLPSSFSS
jgi:hypothetical protein